MKNYLITGIAGTGKSAVGRVLAAYGYLVLETDRAPENRIAYRERIDTRTGEVSMYERGDGWNELQHVQWNIIPDALRPDLKGADNVTQFVCGYADNWSEMRDDFDSIFLLEAAPSTIKNRLLHRDTGDWGRKYPEELKHALYTAEIFNTNMKNLDAIILNAEMPLVKIAKRIINSIQ